MRLIKVFLKELIGLLFGYARAHLDTFCVTISDRRYIARFLICAQIKCLSLLNKDHRPLQSSDVCIQSWVQFVIEYLLIGYVEIAFPRGMSTTIIRPGFSNLLRFPQLVV